MRTILIAFLITLAASAPSLAFITKGEMSCTIQDQQIFTINDGQTARYKNYKNDLKQGDIFDLTYQFDSKTGEFKIEKKSTSGPLSPFNGAHSANLIDNDSILAVNDNHNFLQAIHYGPYKITPVPNQSLVIRQNSVSMSYTDGSETLKLTRYYKSDWHGIQTRISALRDKPIQTDISSFDCRHLSTDNWQTVFEAVMSTAIHTVN